MELTIGIASYGKPERLARTLETVCANTVSDYRVLVIDNPTEKSEECRRVVERWFTPQKDVQDRITFIWMGRNVGYAGAVNELFNTAHTEHIAYCDDDIEILTPRWDEVMLSSLGYPEVGMVFPGVGHYGFHNGRYNECLWNAGYCWMTRRKVINQPRVRYDQEDIYFDTELGHHEEVDFMIRLRLAGYQIACAPSVNVVHHETSTQSDPRLHQPGGRIHDGVVRWMNKWNRYFCGDQLQYSMDKYDPRALRYTDWPPCALYLERFFLHHFPELNKAPRTVHIPGTGEMDVIEVLKPKGCYHGRAI